MKNLIKNFLIFFAVFLLIVALFGGYLSTANSAPTVGIDVLVNQVNNSYIQLENSFRKLSTNDPIVTGIAALVIGGSCLFLSGKVVYDIFSKKEK